MASHLNILQSISLALAALLDIYQNAASTMALQISQCNGQNRINSVIRIITIIQI